jgi:hypothetical protein
MSGVFGAGLCQTPQDEKHLRPYTVYKSATSHLHDDKDGTAPHRTEPHVATHARPCRPKFHDS